MDFVTLGQLGELNTGIPVRVIHVFFDPLNNGEVEPLASSQYFSN